MTRIQPIYLAAVALAIAAALVLTFLGVAQPWPAAVALNVYGLVAWPEARHEIPVSHRTYAGGWITAALVLALFEKLAPLVQ